MACLASICIHECRLCLNYKFEVGLTCLGSIRVKLDNACKRIEFEAIQMCLVSFKSPFDASVPRKVISKCIIYV